MKHGDISNQCSFNIGFRCENLLLTPRKGVKDILLNAVSGKWANAEVDKEVLKTMYDIYWNTEYTISLVVDNATYGSRGFKERIEDFPFSTINNVIDHVSEITMWLNTGQMTYFVTSDIIEKSLVNSRYAVTFEDFLHIYHRRGLRRNAR